MVRMGALPAGEYRVERGLDQGGMGVVVRATHLQLQPPGAVKPLIPEVPTNPEVVQRFLRAPDRNRIKRAHVGRAFL